MRCLLGNVVAAGSIRVVPVASECLAENGIERLLDSTIRMSVLCPACVVPNIQGDGGSGLRRLDVPSTEVEFGDGNKSFERILNLWQL